MALLGWVLNLEAAAPVTGTVSVTEADDVAVITGYMIPVGTLAVTEENDILMASGPGGVSDRRSTISIAAWTKKWRTRLRRK